MRFADPPTHKTNLPAYLSSADTAHDSPSLAAEKKNESLQNIDYSSRYSGFFQPGHESQSTEIANISCGTNRDVSRRRSRCFTYSFCRTYTPLIRVSEHAPFVVTSISGSDRSPYNLSNQTQLNAISHTNLETDRVLTKTFPKPLSIHETDIARV